MPNRIFFGDNLPILKGFPEKSFQLIYIDPPFNTGRRQARTQLRTTKAVNGDRTGFSGKRYETVKVGTRDYADEFIDYPAFLEPRLREAHRILEDNGSLYFHIDYREAHYCKVQLDSIFGRDCFINEIIWAYDYGARTRKKWPPKHDTIFWYVKNLEISELGKPSTLLADNGYFSQGSVNACDERDITPLIALGRDAHHLPLEERLATDAPEPGSDDPVVKMAHALKTQQGRAQ